MTLAALQPKDYRQSVRSLLDANPGATLVVGGKHARLVCPGLPDLTLSLTMSDWRGVRNTRALARRNGWRVP